MRNYNTLIKSDNIINKYFNLSSKSISIIRNNQLIINANVVKVKCTETV